MALHPIQDLIKSRLATISWLTTPLPVPVFLDDDGDLEAKITVALAQLNGGLAIIIHTPPEAQNQDPRMPKVSVEWQVSVTAVEDPLINRGADGFNKTAFAASGVIAKSLHGWAPGQLLGQLRFINISSDIHPEGNIKYTTNFKFVENL